MDYLARLRVEGLLQEGDEGGEQSWVAQDLKQQGGEGCDCHGSPFIELEIGANDWPFCIPYLIEISALLINRR